MKIPELARAYYLASKSNYDTNPEWMDAYRSILFSNAKNIIDVLWAIDALIKSDRIDCDYTWAVETMLAHKDVPTSPIHASKCRACELRKAIKELER